MIRTPRSLSDSSSFRFVLMVVLTGGFLALALDQGVHDCSVSDRFCCLSLVSPVVVFLSVRPLRNLLYPFLLTAILLPVQTMVLRWPVKTAAVSALFGLSTSFALGIIWLRSSGDQRSLLRYAFLPPLLLIVLGYAASPLLGITGMLHAKTFDLFLYAFDASLRVQMSFDVGRLVLSSRALTWVTLASYYALPLVLMLAYAKQLVRCREMALTAFLAFMVAGPVGTIFYNLLPACGPLYLVGAEFPFHPLSTQHIRDLVIQPVLVAGARNAFPSLHMAWALLAWWYSEGLSRTLRSVFFTFLGLTVVATLGLGEHYFIDLVAALPFALMIEAGCTLQMSWKNRLRGKAFASGLVLTLAWVAFLRFALRVVWVSPLIPWSLIALTIALCLRIRVQLRTGLLEASGPTPS
jgi:PAP2 superfamily